MSDKIDPIYFYLILLQTPIVESTVPIVVEGRNPQMEFPPEILAIIREYAKPAFKYYREYNHALKIIHLNQWLTLREMLNEEILPALMAYLNAREEWYNAMNAEYTSHPIGFNSMVIFRQRQRLYEMSQSKKFTTKRKFNILTRLLYGEEKECYQLRHKQLVNTWI
jgi:hypothetical protein